MSYRLNPYKIFRFIVILGVIGYLGFLVFHFKKTKTDTTNEIKNDVKVRNKDFFKSKDYKNNLTLPQKSIEENNKNVVQELKTEDKTEEIKLPSSNQSTNEKKSEQLVDNNQNFQSELEKKRQKVKAEEQALKKRQQEEAKKAEQARIEKAKSEKAKIEQQKKLAAQQKAKAEAKKGPRKYIQVASLKTEAGAKSVVKKLGGNFYYKKTSVNGKTAYVVMSSMTNDNAKLNAMQNIVKSRYGSGYMIRNAGK